MKYGYWLLLSAGVVAFLGASLYLMGQPLICDCGYIKLWHGVVFSSENSQHISDWYTPSHVIHGFIFYWILYILFPKQSVWMRLFLATTIEVGWELFENTDFIISRYRETTIALDYFGDSIINSVSDTLAMIAGFLFAWRAPILATIILAIVLELFVGYIIRDNLTLNIIMLLYPFEGILEWQKG